jgi:hypothetical protein
MASPERTREEEQPVSGAIDKVSHGQADETPLLALTGVTIVVGAFVALVVGISLALYFLV